MRIPASFCGLYGIRTTKGRIDTKGCMDMAPSFDTIGWFANSAGVFSNVGMVLLGGEPQRAAVSTLLIADDGFAQADDDVGALLRIALERMQHALPSPQHARLAPDGLDPWREAVRVIQAHEIWQVYGRFVEEKHPRFGPGVAERMKIASSITAAQAERARAVRAAAREHILSLIKPGTIVALPTAPSIAPLVDMPRGCARIPSPAGNAAHLHRRPRRPAADQPTGRHGFGLPGRPVADRLGGRRRGAVGPRRDAFGALRHCRLIVTPIVTLSPSHCLVFRHQLNCRKGAQVLTIAKR